MPIRITLVQVAGHAHLHLFAMPAIISFWPKSLMWLQECYKCALPACLPACTMLYVTFDAY